MSVVMTPARTLLRADSRCAAEHLECQVLGARVCIDSLNACDGVANCGSYDVYDEDRLMCGASAGLQHNVCLAAFTFLAVLLTILYTIHYWLKRCVPKVSDAFFIYTDAAENVLYLDPIMRSPHDMDDPKDIIRGAAMNEYMECTEMPIQENRSSIFTRWTRRFRCKRKVKQSSITSDPIVEGGFSGQMEVRNQRYFSFAEVELRKMATPFLVEAAVQTGSSLEMQFTDKRITKERMTQFDSQSDIVAHYEGKRRSTQISVLDVESIGKEPSDELSLLNFFKRARSVSMQMPSVPPVGKTEAQHKQSRKTQEKEVQCFEYEHSHISSEIISVLETIGEISDVKPEIELVRKRIRFEEQRSRLPSDDDDVDEEAATDSRLRRSAFYGGIKQVHSEDTDTDSNFDEPSTSTGNREFKKYFWGGGKNKPKKPAAKKKKQQSTLR
ncbi:hypothetical protein PYW07_014615 [Mythimna separata]|uniref:Uncharacterized protein n=1 Tax=Mythimna separata TaxID=271217 RepID=A0AAD8E0L9_MYTSE|nr:hypothetical protein PYW07_014615 [Mythimna separata]